MTQKSKNVLNAEELNRETAVELPSRHLMATVSVLGLPLVGVSDVAVNVDTSGPGWLVGSIGSVA